MTNKGNIATAWYTLSVIRSSAGYVFFFSHIYAFLACRVKFSQYDLHLQRLRQCEIFKGRGWEKYPEQCSMFLPRELMLVIISKLQFPLIIPLVFFLFFFAVWSNTRHFRDHENCVTEWKHKNCVLYNRCKSARWHSLLSEQSFGNDAQTTVYWTKQANRRKNNEAHWDIFHSIAEYLWQHVTCYTVNLTDVWVCSLKPK